MTVGTLALAVLMAGCSSRPTFSSRDPDLRRALTFHASFDRGTDADHALGDGWLYHAPAMDQWQDTRPGLPPGTAIRVVPEAGKFGGALQFLERTNPVVFYKAEGNVPWSGRNWSGTVSFWLRTDLRSLPEGFNDPVQITPRRWNDAAFFVEFEKRSNNIPFRLGAYADFNVWNPRNRRWEDIPPAERPLVTIPGPPFSADRWTHVAFTWERFNTGQPDGVATLYLDGAQVGRLSQRTQTFTWDSGTPRLLVGLGYLGWFDDLAVFNRALTQSEIQQVRRLPRGIRSILQP